MQRVNARWSCAGRDGEHRLSFQVRIKQLEDVSLARSCRRLHHHVFSLLQRAHCLLLPQIGNNQPRPNRAHGTSEIEGKVARVATSKLGDERVSNPGVILGRCLQCGLLAIGIEWSLMGSATWKAKSRG